MIYMNIVDFIIVTVKVQICDVEYSTKGGTIPFFPKFDFFFVPVITFFFFFLCK